MHRFLALCCLLLAAALAAPAHAAESADACAHIVTSPGDTLSEPGIWCLDKDQLSTCTGRCSPYGVHLAVPDIILDCQGHRLDLWLYATADRSTVRHCVLAGRVELAGQGSVFEDNRLRGDMHLNGTALEVRRNVFVDQAGFAVVVFGGDFDIADNTFLGAATPGAGMERAIFLYDGTSGTVRGNRIHRISCYYCTTGGYDPYGIISLTTGRLAIVDNEISGIGEPDSTGIVCTGTKTRVRGNLVNGFHVAIGAACGDAGGNDRSP